MRYLAIDLGDKRTGLAVGDDATRIPSPLTVIETGNHDERLRRIGLAIREHHPDALVVGLPLDMAGTEGTPARHARVFADQLSQRFGLKTHLVDERLSSYAADQQMNGSGLTRKRKRARRDALAAAVILQAFFESQ